MTWISMFIIIVTLSLVVILIALRWPVSRRPSLSLSILAVELLVAHAVHHVDACVEQVLDEHCA
jgi:hypothetical protein